MLYQFNICVPAPIWSHLSCGHCLDRFFSIKFFSEKIMYPAIYRVVSSLSWLREYDSSGVFTLTCLKHSLSLLCKLFWRKSSNKLPYNRSLTFCEHRFSHKIFSHQFSHKNSSDFVFWVGPGSAGGIMKTSSRCLHILFLWS